MIYCKTEKTLAEIIQNWPPFLHNRHKAYDYGCSVCGAWLSETDDFEGCDDHIVITAETLERLKENIGSVTIPPIIVKMLNWHQDNDLAIWRCNEQYVASFCDYWGAATYEGRGSSVAAAVAALAADIEANKGAD